jgi:hypothetical protein
MGVLRSHSRTRARGLLGIRSVQSPLCLHGSGSRYIALKTDEHDTRTAIGNKDRACTRVRLIPVFVFSDLGLIYHTPTNLVIVSVRNFAILPTGD